MATRLISSLLVPLFLIASFVCLCAHAAAVIKVGERVDCCGHIKRVAGTQQPGKNTPCQHCVDKEKIVSPAPADSVTLDAALAAAYLTPPPLLALAISPELSLAAGDAAQRDHPSPPPDVLRVKCVLQV